MQNPSFSSASVRVLRSYDYCHFEISLSSDATSAEAVDELRKTAARLSDKAVAQYKIAKQVAQNNEARRNDMGWRVKCAQATPEGERTEEEKATLKAAADKAFAERQYGYEDDWDDEEERSSSQKTT